MPHGRLAVWYFWYFAFIGAFLPYFALYLQSIGMSAGRIAVLMSLGQFMRLVAPLLWSWLADSVGRRVRIVVASTAAALASFSVVFLTEDFVGLLLGMAVLHFFWSASLPPGRGADPRPSGGQPRALRPRPPLGLDRFHRDRDGRRPAARPGADPFATLGKLGPAARDAAQRPDPDRGERACGAGLRSHHRGAAPAQGAVPARCGPVHDRIARCPLRLLFDPPGGAGLRQDPGRSAMDPGRGGGNRGFPADAADLIAGIDAVHPAGLLPARRAALPADRLGAQPCRARGGRRHGADLHRPPPRARSDQPAGLRRPQAGRAQALARRLDRRHRRPQHAHRPLGQGSASAIGSDLPPAGRDARRQHPRGRLARLLSRSRTRARASCTWSGRRTARRCRA
jgi:hypothetical protein